MPTVHISSLLSSTTEAIEMTETIEKYQYLAFCVKILKIFNLWVKLGENTKNKWTDIRSYYIILVLLPSVFPIIYDLILLCYEGDSEAAIVVSIAIACILGTFYLSICFIKNREAIRDLLEQLDQFKQFTSTDLQTIDEKANSFCKLFLLYSTVGLLTYITMPLFSWNKCEANKSKNMIENGIPCGLTSRYRMPFKFDYSPLMELIWVHQVISCYTVTYVVTALSMLLYGILYHTTEQIKILRRFIVDMACSSNDEVAERVHFCIKYHNAVIEYSQKTNAAFSSQMLMHLTLTSFVISILCYEVLVATNTLDILRYFLHLLGWLGLLFLLCFSGQNLMDESLGIAFDAYSTPWYNIPNNIQKEIKVIIMRAQKPLTLNAANLGVISLESYLKIMRSAYSYFTLLTNMKN